MSGAVEGDIFPSTFTKKQLEKRFSTKRESRKYQDSDVQIFQKIPGADGNINKPLN
jgi:hypothetical protein